MPSMEVWIEYASTYSYLTVTRIGALAAARGVALDWRPFALGMVRAEQQLGFPFPPESPKTAYMWLDLERRARQLGLPYRRPETYPVNSLLTARMALVAAREGWCQAFSERVFRLHWVEGRLIGSDDNIRSALQSLGRDRIIADADEVVRRAPDIVFGSWCGKKYRPLTVAARPGWSAVPAVRDNELHEIKSPLILQPGPAALTDGLDALHRVIAAWAGR